MEKVGAKDKMRFTDMRCAVRGAGYAEPVTSNQ